MLGTQHLTLFVVSGILLNLTPGQDTLYIVGRGAVQGRRAGILLQWPALFPGASFTPWRQRSVCRRSWPLPLRRSVC